MEEEALEFDLQVVEFIFSQLALKAAKNQWGDDAMKASEKEMKQLKWWKSFQPVHWSELNEEQRRTVLKSHICLQKKRTSEVKAWMKAGSNRQWRYIDKEKVSSLMAATKSVLLSCIIDAREGHDVAVIDIPNAFVQMAIEEEKDRFIVRMRGEVVDILCHLAPEIHAPFVIKNKQGNKQIHVKCLNDLYGWMVVSLLYYKKFMRSL